MFTYFNKSATIRFEDIKVRVQIEVEIEESIGKLITGGEKEFQFNTDKKTVITASTRNNHNTHHRILERFYKDISQLVIEEFNVDSSVFKKRTKVLEKIDPNKILFELTEYKLEILIFNVIIHPETILNKIIELYPSDWLNYTKSRWREPTHRENYYGEFKHGYYNGKGTLRFADGSRYEGEFKNGYYNGKGTLRFTDGSRYEGEFKDGEYNGKGTLRFTDGSRYEGEFKDGNHWTGIRTNFDGSKTEWKDGSHWTEKDIEDFARWVKKDKTTKKDGEII